MKNDKNAIKHAVDSMRLYTEHWEDKYDFFEVDLTKPVPNVWAMLIENSKQTLIVVEQTKQINFDLEEKGLNLTNKEALLDMLKTYEDPSFVIYYKNVDYDLIGYLLDFFEYYVELPNKIKAKDW